MTSIGFIGLGIMGAPMAGHLLDRDHEVVASTHRLVRSLLMLRQAQHEEDCLLETVILLIPSVSRDEA